jgi:hypothetical protein
MNLNTISLLSRQGQQSVITYTCQGAKTQKTNTYTKINININIKCIHKIQIISAIRKLTIGDGHPTITVRGMISN